MNKTRLILIGLGLLAVALIAAAVPRSESYSSFGHGAIGQVDIECGSAFGRKQNVDFADPYEESWYLGEKSVYREPRIFEGKTETEVCDDLLQSTKTVSILAAVVGSVLLLVGLAQPSTAASPDSSSGTSPPAAPSEVADDAAVGSVEVAETRDEQQDPNDGELGGSSPPSLSIRPAVDDVTASATIADGTTIDFGRFLVIGRNPTVPAYLEEAQVLAVDDPTFTISKTHALVGIEEGELWVEDLHSSNGTEIREPSADEIRPGMRRFVGREGTIRLGEVSVSLTLREAE